MLIVTCAQMKKMERSAIEEGISSLRLMENAGSAASRCIRETTTVTGKRCLVLCGRGNNGGDGFVVARRLIEFGAQVAVIMACGAPSTEEAAEMFDRLITLKPVVIDASQTERCTEAVNCSDIIIDAVYGTGFHGALKDENVIALFAAVNKSDANAKIYSLDMPSGANADTGEVSDGCVNADVTITFGAPKTGQYIYPAAKCCGTIVTVGIGLPDIAYMQNGEKIELLDAAAVAKMLPVRDKDSNKGDFGKVLCLCGSLGMAGAAYLSASGALRCGAGLVTLGVPQTVYVPVAAKLNECMVYPLDATAGGAIAYSCRERIHGMMKKVTALLIGCGLSQDNETQRLIHDIVLSEESSKIPIILDADGINAFDGHIDLLRTSKAELILTPHPGEMARLCGMTVAQIQKNRIDIARTFAKENGVTLVLKGANTVIAAKDGQTFINPTGNPGMAKGGSGDILAGMIAGLRAQGIAPEKAACCGAYIHGSAGDRAAGKLSQYGVIPTDMLMEVPQIFREMSR